MSNNKLHKYLVLDRQARVITVCADEVVNEYIDLIHPSPVASAAIGRLLCATLMMGSTLKGNETVMVIIDGGGPLGSIRAEADAFGHVRALATNPYVDLPLNEHNNLDVAKAVGNDGYLYVRKQLNMKEPYEGSCELISGEIAEDLSYYYGTSEQTPTVIALGITIDTDHSCKLAGGFLIQLLPKATEETYQRVENMLHDIKSVSKLLEEYDGDHIIDALFKKEEIEELFDYDVMWQCTCSKDVSKKMVMQLKDDEILEEIEKDEGLDVTCNFCNKKYHLTTEDLKEIYSSKKGS